MAIDGIHDIDVVVVAANGQAEQAINDKWASLGGAPGASLHGTGADTLIGVPGGFKRSYQRGTIYTRQTIADGDWRFNPFFLNLATDQRYDQLGGPASFLGFPVSDLVPDPSEPGSGVTKFENGAIYYWPDLGAIEMREISLRYVGFYCFGESDDGPFSTSDEVYFTFGVVPALVDLRSAAMTRLYEGVNANRSQNDLIELYRGLPFGAALSVTLIEHDDGDPNKYHELAKKGVEKASEKVVEGLAEIPVVGTALAAIGFVVLVIAEPAITDAVNDLIGSDDEVIGHVELALTPKDMMRLTREGRQNYYGIQAHIESPLISGDGASYKVYFDIDIG